MNDSAAPRRRRPGGRTRETAARIETAVSVLLMQEGYDGVTFARVAEQAGVDRTTLYRRWPDRAAMAFDIVNQVGEAQVVIPDTGSLETDLEGLLLSLAGFLTSPFGRAALAAEAELRRTGMVPPQRRIFREERLVQVRNVFVRAQARGELAESGDIDAVIAMMAGSILFRLLGDGEVIETAWVHRIVRLACAALQ